MVYSYLDENVMANNNALIIMFVISLLLFISSFSFLISGIKSGKDKKAVSKHTNIGEIKISVNSIENIALNASKKINGVRDTRANVTKLGESVSVTIRVIVMPDVNIPTLSEDIQARVKRSVEESSGVAVNDVKVVVDSIYSGAGFKPRVE